MKKTIVPIVLTAAATSLVTLGAYHAATDSSLISMGKGQETPFHYVANTGATATQPVDFSPAAESSVKSVVHVKTMTQGKTVVANDFFWGPRQYRTPDQQGAGSGVIISSDGYIITNNHVVQGADQVQVTFNDRNTQLAKVVGADPSTDIAVLKIESKNLPIMEIGNSDQVKLGQWVLAVGYPLNLDATVTAGIVSAKSRSLGMNQTRSRAAVESYIQTDAAVNPGNSGGALVNVQGQLIGINAAIASPTGSYAGYSYAIPSNLAMKVASDIIKFGSVQRGYLGVQLQDLNKLNEPRAKQLGINPDDFKNSRGVYVVSVMSKSGAEHAGLRAGDLITSINGTAVNSEPQLTEQVARFHPGDKISVGYIRNNKENVTSVELRDMAGEKKVGNASNGLLAYSGATLKAITATEAKENNIAGGIMVTDITKGSAFARSSIQKGFIITSINDQVITNAEDFNAVISQEGDELEIGGIYPGRRGMYYYGLKGQSQESY
jgi:serine protease Do